MKRPPVVEIAVGVLVVALIVAGLYLTLGGDERQAAPTLSDAGAAAETPRTAAAPRQAWRGNLPPRAELDPEEDVDAGSSLQGVPRSGYANSVRVPPGSPPRRVPSDWPPSVPVRPAPRPGESDRPLTLATPADQGDDDREAKRYEGPDALSRALRERQAAIQACMARWRGANPQAPMVFGLPLSLRVAPAEGPDGPVGRVTGLRADSVDVEHEALERCLLGALGDVAVDAPGGDGAVVHYSLTSIPPSAPVAP